MMHTQVDKMNILDMHQVTSMLLCILPDGLC